MMCKFCGREMNLEKGAWLCPAECNTQTMTPPTISPEARKCADAWREANKHYEPTEEHIENLAIGIQLAINASTEALAKFKESVIVNAPKCAACAESIFTGGTWSSHDADCIYTKLEALAKENAELKRVNSTLVESFQKIETHVSKEQGEFTDVVIKAIQQRDQFQARVSELEARKPMKIELKKRLDALKSNWFEWACEAETSPGVWQEGTVQADGSGELIAEDTFEGLWLSAETKTPADGQRVICKYDGVYGPRLVTFWCDAGGNPHFGLPNESDGKGSQPATHWMELQ